MASTGVRWPSSVALERGQPAADLLRRARRASRLRTRSSPWRDATPGPGLSWRWGRRGGWRTTPPRRAGGAAPRTTGRSGSTATMSAASASTVHHAPSSSSSSNWLRAPPGRACEQAHGIPVGPAVAGRPGEINRRAVAHDQVGGLGIAAGRAAQRHDRIAADGTAHEHHAGRRRTVGPLRGHLADQRVAGPVEHQAEGALGAVGEHQHDGAVEARVGEERGGHEESTGEGPRGGRIAHRSAGPARPEPRPPR